MTNHCYISFNSAGCKSKLNLCARTRLSQCKNSLNTGPQARLPLPPAPHPFPTRDASFFFTLSLNFYFFCCLLNALATFLLRRTQTTQLVFPLWGVHKPLSPSYRAICLPFRLSTPFTPLAPLFGLQFSINRERREPIAQMNALDDPKG